MNTKQLQLVTVEQKEEWRDIPEYEGVYQVSNLGNLKRMAGSKFNKLTKRYNKDAILSYRAKNSRYIEVGLWKNNIGQRYKLHRLVATVFISNPESRPEVNHIDGNKKNNCVDNLEWVTRSENIKHAFRTGLNKANKSNKGKFLGNHPCSKPIVELDGHGKITGVFSSIKEATIKYNLPEGEVSRVCSGKRKHVKGKHFAYAAENALLDELLTLLEKDKQQ
jgi:hypothetical protein